MVPIYLPTAIMGFTRKLVINFVNEKKEKYKEYQKVGPKKKKNNLFYKDKWLELKCIYSWLDGNLLPNRIYS